MKREYLEGGRIRAAHGVRGALKVEHLCDSASVLAKQKRVFLKMGNVYSERRVLTACTAGEGVIMTIEGVDTREAAIAMRDTVIYLHRTDIPVSEGAMLIADMIGLPVYHSETGDRLGEISDISDIAARRIYSVRTDKGEVLLPDVDEFIKEISEEGMRVLPIPGFFDDEI